MSQFVNVRAPNRRATNNKRTGQIFLVSRIFPLCEPSLPAQLLKELAICGLAVYLGSCHAAPATPRPPRASCRGAASLFSGASLIKLTSAFKSFASLCTAWSDFVAILLYRIVHPKITRNFCRAASSDQTTVFVAQDDWNRRLKGGSQVPPAEP